MQEDDTLSTLTVTERGQITLRKEILRHLGVAPGGKIEVLNLPNGGVTLRASRPDGTVRRFVGVLAGKTKKVASLEEIGRAARAGWAGRK